MNILITRFPYESQLSGEEWHTICLAEKLRQRGHRIYLLSSCAYLLSEFSKRNFYVKKVWASKPPVTVGRLVVFILLASLIFVRLGYELWWQKKVHAIETVYFLSLTEKLLLSPIARLFGMRIVWVEHARIGKWLTKNPFLLLYLLWNRVCVHKVIFVSHQSLELLPGLKRSVVIPNGIDLTLFNPEIRHIHAINVLPHKAKGEIWVGTITRLSKDKGIPDLIQATLMLRKKIPQLNCWIVGEGTEEKNLKKAFKERCVHFVGAIKHEYVADFMRQLDVFVLPSCLHDPFGLVAAEAMAVGRPLLVTEVCGIVDFLKNGVHALIVPARNPKRLSSALMKLLTDEKLRVRMAHAGFEHARKRFDVERMVDEYVKELEK